ncbi:MAG: hypothetical protein FWD49_00260 [Firmicutes bacterium]|nr:hypothetical protein [Bacillota bacterium]
MKTIYLVATDTKYAKMYAYGSTFNDLIGQEVCGFKFFDAQKTDKKGTLIDSYASAVEAQNAIRHAILEKHFNNGVLIQDPSSCHIEKDVEIGADTVIYPMNYLRGNTKLGKNVTVFSYCDITDTEIGDNTDIRSSFSLGAKIGNFCTVGPFATLRTGVKVGDRCRVGDYVEIKNSTLENDVKAAHLAYIGDSYVGEGTNVGCGTVFANYDGYQKRSVHVGKNVFIGCNSNLVAPLTVEDGAFIAAGSTVTQDVPGDSLCIARAKQVIKTEWKRK